MSSISVDTSEADAAMRDLRAAGHRAGELSDELLERGVEIARAAQGRQFESSGGEFGSPWRELAPSTLEQKSREGYSARILVATGDLERKLTTGAVAEKSGDSVELVGSPTADDGTPMVPLHQRERRILAPEGVAGRGRDELERAGEKMADRLEQMAVGQ